MLTVDNRTLKMASESIFIHIQFISERQTQFPDGKTMFLVTIRNGLLSQDMTQRVKTWPLWIIILFILAVLQA